jgi:hypothetical protein
LFSSPPLERSPFSLSSTVSLGSALWQAVGHHSRSGREIPNCFLYNRIFPSRCAGSRAVPPRSPPRL